MKAPLGVGQARRLRRRPRPPLWPKAVAIPSKNPASKPRRVSILAILPLPLSRRFKRDLQAQPLQALDQSPFGALCIAAVEIIGA